ncbi:MAG: phenylacetate-CoA oxygenase subunit PaaJ [Gammaproteobacteria bacterium]|nr:phenylacetate-CoA oxygenase subunit PaaJ [Gammaproteobacteria bacterium]
MTTTQMQLIPTKSSLQYEREQFRNESNVPHLWALLDEVTDPEIPVLSLWDIGILKDISQQDQSVTVVITPTYSGCPAMDVIREDITAALTKYGIAQVNVELELTPAWTTDWMTNKGREQLRGYGIAPPVDTVDRVLTQDTQVQCPHCGSHATRLVSEFASTACKALFQCNDCSEPFDLFKHI